LYQDFNYELLEHSVTMPALEMLTTN